MQFYAEEEKKVPLFAKKYLRSSFLVGNAVMRVRVKARMIGSDSLKSSRMCGSREEHSAFAEVHTLAAY